MTLHNIYIIPHGDELIDLPTEGSIRMSSTIREIVKYDKSEVLAIASPHGVRLSRTVPIVNTERFAGSFDLSTRTIEMKLSNERPLAELILKESGDDAEEVGFVTVQGEKSVFPLDFGTLIPLNFFNKRPIVYLGQSRLRDRQRLLRFGEELYRAISNYGKRVSLVMSADQAHTHSSEGPYGFSADAEVYEEILKNCIKTGDFSELLSMDDALISNAKPDSYWNMVILSSVLKDSGRRMTLDFSYVEKYFGMLCAHSYGVPNR